MAFIKMQKLVRNSDGSVKPGSASIMTTEYDRSYKGRSRHRTREKLGKVVSLDDAGKAESFFLRPGGLVYSAASDSFERVGKEDPRVRGEDYDGSYTGKKRIPIQNTLPSNQETDG